MYGHKGCLENIPVHNDRFLRLARSSWAQDRTKIMLCLNPMSNQVFGADSSTKRCFSDELNDWVKDLSFSKNAAELLGIKLRVCSLLMLECPLSSLDTVRCSSHRTLLGTNIVDLMDIFQISYHLAKRSSFLHSSSLKTTLRYNDSLSAFTVVGYSVHHTKIYNNLEPAQSGIGKYALINKYLRLLLEQHSGFSKLLRLEDGGDITNYWIKRCWPLRG